MLRLLLLGAVMGLHGCAAAAAGVSPAERDAVVATAETLFAAMQARDTAAIRGLFVPDAPIVAITVGEGAAAAPQHRTLAAFIASIARPGEPLLERMWDPRVEIDGDFASLWAPYDFHIGDRFSHCGTDAFHLVRRAGRWRIVGLSYTLQTAGCGPRGPGS
ncbi:MAG TPA: nuclear transport factor 2 family protein [Longimicrobiaceae bacterium]|nr:nuclear transport factor 2 family protein [Longimicrobiaceae bacterium]